MNKVISGETLNDLTVNIMKEVMDGEVSTSRNGEVHFLNNALLELKNPRARHVALVGRKNNIFATIAETFWVMSGEDKLDPYMSFFLPRAKDFSDNGVDWRGAYGPRIYENNQVQGVIDIFRSEGLDTRRAVISIYDSDLDSPTSLKKKYDLDSSKDIPCNNLLHFYVKDGKLNCNAFSRSGDVVWGVTNINIFEWTFLMEYIAQEIGVGVGTYSHFVTNLHVYDFTKQQVEDVLSFEDQPLGDNHLPLIFPTSDGKARQFFKDYVGIVSKFIVEDSFSFGEVISEVQSLFSSNGVVTRNNLLWSYTRVVLAYVSHKKKKKSYFAISMENGNFKDSVVSSSFRKFEVQ